MQALYAELKDSLQALAGPLLDFTQSQVQRHGSFHDVGAVLRSGQVELHAAAPETVQPSPEEVLELLQAGLQHAAEDAQVEAVAIAEWVRIGVDAIPTQDAIKVHVHHRRGLAVAFYLPATKRLLRGWQFGAMVVKPAGGIVQGWIVQDAA